MAQGHRQIGEVAERTGLSLRTIRYYEEVGLLTPAARSTGGFRLYSEADVARLEMIKRMKPLDFSLDQMRELLEALDGLTARTLPATQTRELLDRLEVFRHAVEERCEDLRSQLASAEAFAASLQGELERERRAEGPAS